MRAGGTGSGSLRVARVRGRSVLIAARASSPLRLIPLRAATPVPWVFTTTFGGGFVDGDHVTLEVDVEPGAALLLTTQASTKVYRARETGAANDLHARIASGGLFVSMPDATVCFEHARFRQRTVVDLQSDASACVVDTLHAGRVARGERWSMAAYRSEVRVAGIRDALQLDMAHGPIAERMGRFDVLTTVVLAGPRFADARARIAAEIAARPVRDEVLESCSVRDDVLLARVASPDAETGSRRVRDLTREVTAIVGNVAARKH